MKLIDKDKALEFDSEETAQKVCDLLNREENENESVQG